MGMMGLTRLTLPPALAVLTLTLDDLFPIAVLLLVIFGAWFIYEIRRKR